MTVVGAGLMGSGIAQVAAQSGFNVTLVDLDASLIQKSEKNIMRNLERVAKRQFSSNDKLRMKTFVEESFARIRSSTNVEESVRATDIVIEAIIENLEAKQKLFALIDTVSVETFVLPVGYKTFDSFPRSHRRRQSLRATRRHFQ